jgi:TP901 family phage tail tape measure protein
VADTPVGTAFVEVRPDLTGFTAELQAALRTAVRGINPPTAGLAKGATAQAALGAATRSTTKALGEQATVMQVNSTELARFSRGVGATALAQFGLRGATLAATSSFLIGAAALTALARAVGTATAFNSQLAVFGATTGATAAQLDKVSAAAKALGRDLSLPGVSATDAATAMTELAKAGLSVEDSIAGARGVLQLAGAANIDFAQATELAASALNAFQLSGKQAGVVADVLANAANAAQGSIVDVGIAFQQAAAIGHQVGLSFQDVTLFITELARAGLTGSDAGTSLRTALIRLINPTAKAKKIFQELGIEVRDSAGNLRPEFFTNLGAAIAGMGAKQRDATLAVIGGQDAIRALSILSRGSAKDVLSLRDGLDKTGTAAAVNQARMIGLAGAGAGLKNTVEGLALTLGQKATPTLIGATNAITGFITAASQSPAIDLLGESIKANVQAFQALGEAVRVVAPVLNTILGAFAGIAGAIGPTAILAGVASYLALSKALGLATGALRLFLAELTASIALGGGLRAGIGILAESFAAFAVSTAGVTLGVSLLAAGLIFLLTRESETSKATKALAGSTRDLANAIQGATDATNALADAQSALKTDKIAAQAARLAAVQARNDLTQSKAAAGTFERQQLENRLAFALDSVRRAEQQVAADRKAVVSGQKDATAADAARFDALKKEADVTKRVAAEIARAQAAASLRFGGDPAREAKAQQDVIDRINERAAAEEKLTGEQHRAVAERLRAIAQLVGKVKDLPLTIDLIFQAPNLDTGLRRVEDNLRITGQKGGADFVEGLRLNLNSGSVGKVLGDLPGVFAQLGRKSGQDFGSQIVAAIAQVMGEVNRLIIAGATRLTIQLSNQTDTLLTNVQRTELTGGSLDQQLSEAKAARARADRELAAADAAVRATHGKSQAALGRQKKALQDVASAQGDIDRIQGEIASKAQDAASARQQKIDNAKKARDAADQSFLTLLGESQAPLDLALSKADLTASLVDNIAAQKALSDFFKKEIAQANTTITDVHLRIQTVNTLTQALIQSQLATKQLVAEQAAAAKQAIIDKRDRQEESLGLDVQIAQVDKNKAKELQAHRALLKFLIDRQKHTTAGTVEWRRLQLKIEQERAAIRDATKAQNEKASALAALEFSFLQTQSGFAANLLGNLLPSGAVAGVVGGGSVTPAGSAPVGGVSISTAVAKDSQKATTPGPSHGQLSTLIALARAQLQVLQGSKAKATVGHPEVVVQRAAHAAVMDTLPW